MDIASVSTAMKTMDLQTKVSVAVLDQTMDLGKSLSQGMVEMIDAAAMERSVNPAVGSNFDMRV